MIVCSCTMITSQDIAEAVSALRTKDPLVVLTPGLIYRQLGKRPVLRQLPAADHQADGVL